MPFSTDRDLLALEPNLFRDVAWSAQTRLSASDASISSTTLTSASLNFTDARIAPGMVALVNDAPLEIVSVDSDTALTISRLRDAPNDEPIPPLPVASGGALRIATFGPQREIVHRQLLAALGLEPAAPEGDQPTPHAGNILNTRDLALIESLGALHLILSSAAALVGESSTLWTKAALYRDRFDHARRRFGARLDLDDDGVVDAIRHITVMHLVRG